MKSLSLLCLAVLIATLAIPLHADDFTAEPDFILLFNGKDFTGWHHREPPGTEGPALDGKTDAQDGRWTVKDGAMNGNDERAKAGRHLLWTTKDYKGNFILRLEFRAAAKTDGGLFFENTQLQCGDYNFYAYKNCKAYKPLDWNAIEVTVKDGVARCTCNGEVLEEAMKIPQLGEIGLEADKGAIEYRRIRIKMLP